MRRTNNLKVKVIGNPNLEELKKVVEQVAYEIYVQGQQKAS